jgi:hypothetical protein
MHYRQSSNVLFRKQVPSVDSDGEVRIGARSYCQATLPPDMLSAVSRPSVEATTARCRDASISGAVALGPVCVLHNCPPDAASTAYV